MKLLIEQYGRVIIVVVVCSFFFLWLTPLFDYSGSVINEDQNQNLLNHTSVELPTLIIRNKPVELNSVFNYKEFIDEAYDHQGNSLIDRVQYIGDVDTAIAGGYNCTFIVRDYLDFKTEVRCSIVVE